MEIFFAETHPALMRGVYVVHVEERLICIAVSPMGFAAQPAPGPFRHRKIVVCFGYITGIVSRLPEQLGKSFEKSRQSGRAAHVLRADGRGIHTGDQAGACGGADPGVGKGLGVADTFCSQFIEGWGVCLIIAIAAQVRAQVLTGYPYDVWAIRFP